MLNSKAETFESTKPDPEKIAPEPVAVAAATAAVVAAATVAAVVVPVAAATAVADVAAMTAADAAVEIAIAATAGKSPATKIPLRNRKGILLKSYLPQLTSTARY
jgi:hypothetical protein